MRFVSTMMAVCILISGEVAAQPNEKAAVEKQKEVIKPLAWMDGIWRGDAWIILPSGERVEMTQTERIGPLLGGAVKVVEGRSYDSDGKTVFNALGVFAYDAQKQKMMFHSYAQGRIGDFEVDIRDNGYAWTIPAGGTEIRYTATITNDTWHEQGESVSAGRTPFKFFEMNLRRIGNSKWPYESAVPPK